MTHRPALSDMAVDPPAVVEKLRSDLQRGFDESAADVYDDMFADDVLWGTPKGQVLQGFTPLNEIHRQMMPANVAPASRFEVMQTIAPAPGVIVAQIKRRALGGGFSEMAMYVLVEHDDRWWLAAAQNTPITETLPR